MADIDFTKKRFLIVDSVKQSSSTLKTFIQNLGCARVDEAIRMHDIVSKCENFDYDCILLGYDLGDGKKNGQQVLEELRVEKLIARHCIVIMITAELSQAMVLAALEHKPNEYLAKPFTLNSLLKRLERSFKKISSMAAIYNAMDDNNHAEVIKLCQQMIDQQSVYSIECLGIISRQYFELKQFNRAEDIYLKHRDTPNCQWADIGLGKIALHKKNFQQANQYFQGIIKQHPHYLAAYDWLANSYQLQKNSIGAENTLAQAISLSPRSFSRMHNYAQLCFDNNHFDKATNAFFQTNDLSKNSIHRQPSIAYSLANSALAYSEQIPKQQIKNINGRVFKILNDINKEFSSPEVNIQTGLLSARLHYVVKDIVEYEASLSRAESILDRRIDELPLSSMEEIAETLLKLNRGLKANTLLFKIKKYRQENSEFLLDNDEQNTNITELNKSKAQAAVESAINLYNSNQFNAALAKLNKALNWYPNHIGIKLNILQVLIVAFEEDRNRLDELQQAKLLVKELKENKDINEHNLRFIGLKQRFYSLKK